MSASQRQLRPCLAELLRTCVKSESMVLQVDKVVTQETPGSSQPEASKSVERFHLTDGRLCMQALLKPSIAIKLDLKAGDLVKVQDFTVKKAKRLNGDGKVIYLGIQELEIISTSATEELEEVGGFIKTAATDIDHTTPARKRRKLNSNRVTFADLPDENKEPFTMMDPASDRKKKYTAYRTQSYELEETDSDDGFESQNVDPSAVQQRRQTLQTIRALGSRSKPADNDDEQNKVPESRPSPRDAEPASRTPNAKLQPSRNGNTADSRTGTPNVPNHHPSALTPPYHNLASLLNPSLPSKNYPLSTLAIIIYISPTLLSRPSSPFPPKRHIKLLDPSLAALSTTKYDPLTDSHQTIARYPQGITLAVYCDAANFKPEAGTMALFRGIVMQKFGGEVILNAYASLKEKSDGERWFVDEEEVLEGMGFDVHGMREWWEERVKEKRAR